MSVVKFTLTSPIRLLLYCFNDKSDLFEGIYATSLLLSPMYIKTTYKLTGQKNVLQMAIVLINTDQRSV